MSEKYHTISKNGITYYVDAYQVCHKVEIRPDVKILEFDDSIESVYMKENFGQFPNVTTLKISKHINTMNILNIMFPNIRHVESENKRFLIGMMLVQKTSSDECVLLNSFCLSDSEVLDLSGVDKIAPQALIGARHSDVINTESLKTARMHLFDRAKKVRIPEHGIVMAGNIVVGADNNPKRYVIPKETALICSDIFFDNDIPLETYNNNVVIKSDLEFCPEKICFYGDDEFNVEEHKILMQKHKVDFLPQNKQYKCINDIIYSNDMKILYCCNIYKKGDVLIPDGVEEIKDDAFYWCQLITSVSIPGSVKKIGSNVFECCSNLKCVNLAPGIEEIGVECFYMCKELKELNIPGSVQKISDSIACGCDNLKRIVLNEGTPKITGGAFEGLNLDELIIASSIKDLPHSSLSEVKNIELCSDELPFGLIESIYGAYKKLLKDRKLSGYIVTKKEPASSKWITITTPSRILYLPSRPSASGISEMKKVLETEGIKAPSNFFQYCLRKNEKIPFAIAEYVSRPDEKTKKYLKENGGEAVEYLTDNESEEEVVRFLKFNLLTKHMLKNVYSKFEDKNMLIAKAYVMDLLNQKEIKDKKFSL